MLSVHTFSVIPLLVDIVPRPICIYRFLYVTLKIFFDILGLQDISDTPLDLLEEDGQLDYSMTVQTSPDARGKKITSTSWDTITDVNLSVSPDQRTAPGGLLGSSNTSQGLPSPTKSTKQQKQGPKDRGTSVPGWVTSDKSTKDKSGDQEGLEVAFLHSELTCIREHVEKIAILPQELTLLRNSVESAQGNLGVVSSVHLPQIYHLLENPRHRSQK